MPDKKRRRWSPDEDAKIRELYPKHGMSWDGWSTELPGRSKQAIQQRASGIGVRVRPWWTSHEDAKIQALYPQHGSAWEGWAAELPARNSRAIADRAAKLGVKGPGQKSRQTEGASGPASPDPDPVPPTTSNTTTKPHRPSRPWTDEQRVKLVKLAQLAVDETRHSLGECAVELARIIKEARASRKGKKHDGR